MSGLIVAPSFNIGSRLKAAGLHLGATVLVASIAAGLVFGVWYPFPYREVSGGRELFWLIVAVDVVVGPLLTFAVFDLTRKGWSHVRRDLTVIALMQLAALGYGLHAVYLARPVFLVFEADRFRVVTAADIDPADMVKAPPAYATLPLWGPKLISTREAKDGQETLESVMLAIAGKDVALRPNWWQPFELSRERVLRRAQPVASLRAKYPARGAELDALVRQTGRAETELRVLPLVGRQTDWAALLDAKTGLPLAYGRFDAF